MSSFTALKTAIQQYIKTNNNEEITGPILQDILLSIVSTLGDTAINDLESALQTETTNRQNEDGNLQNNINSEASTRSSADTALQGSITTLNAKINEGYLYKGIATPTTDPSTPTGRLFYIATAAGTYTNFIDANSQPLVVTKGINILKYNGSWEVQQVIAIDDKPTAGSDNLAKSGGIHQSIMEAKELSSVPVSYTQKNYFIGANGKFGTSTTYKHSATPVSVGEEYLIKSSDNTYTRYAFATSDAVSSGGDIPLVGGTSVVELPANSVADVIIPEGCTHLLVNIGDAYPFNVVRCSKSVFKTGEVLQEVSIVNEPTYNSNDLTKSGGVFGFINPDIPRTDNNYLGKTGNVLSTTNDFSVSDFYYIVPNTKIYGSRCHNVESADYTYLCFYDVNKKFLSRLTRDSIIATDVTITSDMIPADAVYFRACLGMESGQRIEIPTRNVPQTISKEIGFVKNPVVLEEGNKYINRYGVVSSSTVKSNYVTKPILAEAGVILYNCHPTSGQEYTFAAMYDVHGDCVKVLKHPGSTDSFDYTVLAEDIPEGAVYMRATTYANGYASNYKFYANGGKLKDMTDALSANSSVDIRIIKQCALSSNGTVYKTSSKYFSVTDFCPVKENIRIIRPHRLSGSERIACFYDENYNFISDLTESSSTIGYVALTANNIPVNAKYFRAIVWNDPDNEYNGDGYIEYQIPVSKVVNSIGGYFGAAHFNYELALLKDRDELVSEIENASNGRCTVLYDKDGYPSLMYKIPKVSIGALTQSLGGLTDVHPAFIVNGVEKDYIYVSVFLTSLYEGHYVSWFGLQPIGRLNISTLRTDISDKGAGWHLETIYERSLIALLAMNLNSPTPTGNTSNGKSHLKPWEYCQLANGSLPGSTLPSRTGIEWINGTQPSAWSHNKEMWGIQDVIGGYHRICDLVKVMDGKIYLANDNKYFANGFDAETFEEDWVDTGAVYDFIDNQIVLSNQRTVVQTEYAVRDYSTVLCNSGFDTLDIDVRKKLALLLLAPRLSSEDADTVFPITGRFGIKNSNSNAYDVTGGAEEYSNSGLGANVISVDLKNNDAHYNMGSRMVYIP